MELVDKVFSLPLPSPFDSIWMLLTHARFVFLPHTGRRQALDLAATSSALARLMGIGWSMHAGDGGSPRLPSSPGRTRHPTTSSITNHHTHGRAQLTFMGALLLATDKVIYCLLFKTLHFGKLVWSLGMAVCCGESDGVLGDTLAS